MIAIVRRTLFLGIVLCGSVSPAPHVSTPETVAGLLPEARMRKLHLVRPDLVSYPLAMEVIC